MKLAASQIAWEEEAQPRALALLQSAGYTGLEIAPTRVAGPRPYPATQAAAGFAAGVAGRFGLCVCSMQSIWFGQSGSIFGPERAHLLNYTKEAVLFAQAAGCGNLVFGCPKNRVLPAGLPATAADGFFAELGAFAARHGAVLALEANPPLYGTNFINTTAQAIEAVRRIGGPGLKVNLDFGAIIENGEDIAALRGQVGLFSHIHISEPHLAPIQKRPQHHELAGLLRSEGYEGYVSVEMRCAGFDALRCAVVYVAEVFA